MANYTIIGSDGKEYGPVSADDLRKWVAEGRADAQSKVRAEGVTEWVRLAEVPELGGAQKAAPPLPLPANLPSATGKTSVMAILSLVLGILGCTALFGLILGIIALVKISNSQGALRGKGLALAGTIVSGVFLVLSPILILAAMLLPALAAAKQKAMEINCMNNEKQLALAVRMYSTQHADHYPPAATWCDAIKPNLSPGNVFNCPAVNSTSLNSTNRSDYAFNIKLDGLDESKVDPQTVVIFESDAGWNANGGPEIASVQHHRNFLNVAFADGHVERVAETRLNSLRWDP